MNTLQCTLNLLLLPKRIGMGFLSLEAHFHHDIRGGLSTRCRRSRRHSDAQNDAEDNDHAVHAVHAVHGARIPHWFTG